jgi:hypothetical protein
VKKGHRISVFPEILDAYGVQASRLKSFLENLANGAEVGASGESFHGAADASFIGGKLATSRDRMEKLRELGVVQLLDAERNGDAQHEEDRQKQIGID